MTLLAAAERGDLRTIPELIGPPRSFDADTALAIATALETIDTRPTSIVAADAAQHQLLTVLEAHHHRAAAFLKVYHGITVAVIAALERGSLTPRFFFERLAGRFAERHFDGVKAELGLDTTTDAARYQLWRPSLAFDNMAAHLAPPTIPGERLPPQTAQALLATRPPLAHFFVGMCCHINLDLAVALDETIREFDVQRQPGLLDQIERGHNFVDAILAEQVARSIEVLAGELGCPISRVILEAGAVPMVGEMSMAIIRQWRARTFPDARRLAAATSEAERARLRAGIYRAGERTTVVLFNVLPALMGVFSDRRTGRALAALSQRFTARPGPVARWLLRARPPRSVKRLLDVAEATLDAAARGLARTRATVKTFNLLFGMQILLRSEGDGGDPG